MKRLFQAKTFLIFVALGAVASFQACGVPFAPLAKMASSNPSSFTDYTPTAAAEDAGVVDGKALYAVNCSACHGAIELSAKLGRSAGTIRAAINDVTQMSALKKLRDVDVEKIAKALNPASNKTGGENPFACNISDDPGVSDLKRLNRREYQTTLLDLTKGYLTADQIKVQMDQLPADGVANVFDTLDSSVSADHIAGYLAVAKQASSILAAQPAWLTKVLNCDYGAQGMTATCWQNFFNGFALSVYRRPLTSQEQLDLKDLYAQNAEGSVATGLQTVTAALLQSPFFIYKVEVNGSAVAGRDDLLQLDAYEIASRLAFFATGKGPDAALLADAKQGVLTTDAGYRAAIARLFASSDAKEHVRQFYSQWVGTNRMPASAHSNAFLAGVNAAALRPEAAQEIDAFTADLTWKSQGTYRDFMTSEKSFVSGPTLASVYGTTVVPNSSSSSTQTLQAENMVASVGRATSEGWNLFANGDLRQTVTLTPEVPTTVNVRAFASLLNNTGAMMNVKYGSQLVGSIMVASTAYANYSFTFSPSVASASLIIEFTNDDYDAATGADRNLYVDAVTVSQQATASLADSGTTLPANQRPGIMSRLAFLLSGTDRTSLVHRGLVVRRNLLCDKINPPSITADNKDMFLAPDPDPAMSLRKQIEIRTASTSCQGCHAMINPAGFVLENYDALARYQTEEKVYDLSGRLLARHPINAKVRPNIEKSDEPEVNGLGEMAEAIANSSKGPACASQQWVTFAMGREPSSADGCLLRNVFDGLMDAERTSLSGDKPGTLLNMLKTPAFDSTFRIRKVGPK